MELMNVEDLEEISRISRHTWRVWIRQGKVPVVRLGRSVRVKKEDYEKFIEDNRTIEG
jgi:excisionase family DNA binding protein